MTGGTGIAGAQDYQPAGQPVMACIACGKEITGQMKGHPRARVVPGLGLIHACSETCAAAPAFADADPSVAAEREACARIADQMAADSSCPTTIIVAKAIAAAILARKNP